MKILLAILCTSIGLSALAQDRFIPNRILVEPRAGVSVVYFDDTLQRQSAKRSHKVGKTTFYIVETSKGDERNAISRLKSNPHIKNAELDKLVPPGDIDPLLENQWHLNNINVKPAWTYTSGNNVTIAILDTGINSNHPDLISRLVGGWNTVDNNTNVSDSYGHGTATAGVAAATYNNSIGIAGIAGSAYIMPIRITTSSDGWASFSEMAEGIIWAADKGAKVVSLSYSGAAGSATVLNAGSYLKSKGGLLFVSAGNTGADPGYLPSDNALSISATNSSNTRTSWSSYGSYVDLAAPGESIFTTEINGGYAYKSGTSFAAPMAAGVAALVFSVNPSITPSAVERVLKSTAVNLGNTTYYGYGLVNAKAAIDAAYSLPIDSTPPTISISSVYSSRVSGTFTIDTNTTDNVGVTKVEFRHFETLLGTDTVSPFSYSLNTKNYPNGTILNITGKAYDAAGNSTVSNVLTFEVYNRTSGKPPKK